MGKVITNKVNCMACRTPTLCTLHWYTDTLHWFSVQIAGPSQKYVLKKTTLNSSLLRITQVKTSVFLWKSDQFLNFSFNIIKKSVGVLLEALPLNIFNKSETAPCVALCGDSVSTYRAGICDTERVSGHSMGWWLPGHPAGPIPSSLMGWPHPTAEHHTATR